MSIKSLFAQFEVRSSLRSDAIVITTDVRTDRRTDERTDKQTDIAQMSENFALIKCFESRVSDQYF